MATIKQDIARAKTIEVLLDNGYTDRIGSLRVKISKGEARRIVDAAPKDGKPTAKWEEQNLLLVPNCADDV